MRYIWKAIPVTVSQPVEGPVVHVEREATQHEADLAADRRKYERLPHGMRLTIVRPAIDVTDQPDRERRLLEGWSQDVSPGGICFLCLSEITEELVWIRTEESADCFGEVRIVRAREVIDGLWEYGCRLERLVPRFLD